jgi:asparagine synthase (glutamine-hydrolysing)
VTRLPNWVLVLSDRLSMAHGLEVRVPFLDRALLELCTEIDANVLLRRGVEKFVLKRAFRAQLPRRVRRRRKKPFFTPITPWYLDGPGRPLSDAYLSESALRHAGLFDATATRAAWTTARQQVGTWGGMRAEWACMMVLTTHLLLAQFTPANLPVYKHV